MALYKQILRWSDLPSGSPANAAETMELEFKADHEPDSSEQAKDIAAFANALGGVIVVGVAERGDRFDRKLMNLGSARTVARAYEDAARDLLAPRPTIDPCIIRFQDNDDSRTLVAVNVDPFPGQLIGARIAGTDGWRFPIRTAARHCICIDPEKAMIYSNPDARKAAILLSRIPESARSKIMVQVFHRTEGERIYNTDELISGALEAIDMDANAVRLMVSLVKVPFVKPKETRSFPIHAPVEDVGAVWSSHGTWNIRLNGAVCCRDFGTTSTMLFYMSGRSK